MSMNPQMTPDLGRYLFDEAHKQLLIKNRIQAVISAYEKALEDPNAKLPTYLHGAIEALRK